MPVASVVHVGMAEIQILKSSGAFSCLGLGSCIGICMIDPVAHVAGMAHVMLPEVFPERPADKPGKFADTAVPELLVRLEKAGANRSRIICAIAGGANVFKFGPEGGNRLEIGRRNAEAVIKHLNSHGYSPRAQDVGGSLGRTMTFELGSGIVTIRTVTQGEKKLCSLCA